VAHLELPVVGTAIGTTPTNGQLLIGNGTNYTLANLTAGSGISITNAAGAISIINTGGSGSIDVTTTNPTTSSDTNGSILQSITVTTDGSLQDPLFSNFELQRYTTKVIHGKMIPIKSVRNRSLSRKERWMPGLWTKDPSCL